MESVVVVATKDAGNHCVLGSVVSKTIPNANPTLLALLAFGGCWYRNPFLLRANIHKVFVCHLIFLGSWGNPFG